MNAAESFLFNYAANALWQLPVLFLTAGLLGRWLPESSRLRYRIWIASLLAAVVLPCAAGRDLWSALSLPHWWWPGTPAGAAHIIVTEQITPSALAVRLPAWGIHLGVALYGGLLLWHAAAFARRLLALARLRRQAVPLRLPTNLESDWRRCLQAFGLGQVLLAEASGLSGPVTLGDRKPLVLLPAGFAARVAATDLLAALAHEAAHIQRRDFGWAVLLQGLTLPIAPFPTTRLTWNRMSAAREILCDRAAAEFLRDRRSYACSLLRLAAELASAPPVALPHAIGLLDANTLERRLMHLQKAFTPLSSRRLWILSAAATVVLACSWTSASAFHLTLAGAGAAQTAEAPAHVVRVSGGVMAGNVENRVSPVYPPDAKAARISGSVVMAATINESGKVERLTVVSGPDGLRAAALDAVHQWTYKPFLLNGQPTAVQTTITVNFQLQ